MGRWDGALHLDLPKGNNRPRPARSQLLAGLAMKTEVTTAAGGRAIDVEYTAGPGIC